MQTNINQFDLLERQWALVNKLQSEWKIEALMKIYEALLSRSS